MNKKIIRVLAFALIGTLLFGCTPKTPSNPSVNDTPQNSNDAPNNNQSNNNDQQPADPVTLTMTYWGSPEEKNAVEGAVALYMQQNPNVKIEATQIPEGDYDGKMAALVSAGTPPNYAYMHGPQGEQFAKEGRFINWFEQLENDPDLSKDDFIDDIWFKLDNSNAWGICSAIECFGIFYNPAAFDAAGVSYPPTSFDTAWTWDQFVDAAKKLTLDSSGKNATEADFNPDSIVQYGVSFETWWGPVQTMVLNNGSDVVLKDGKTFGYAEPAGYNAIQLLADLINVHKVAPSTQAAGLPPQAAGLQAGVYAMAIAGQWVNLDMGAANANYGLAALPKMPDSGKTGTIKLSGASVMFNTGDPVIDAAAWDFTKFMCGDGVKSLYENGLWMPTQKKFYTDPALLAEWASVNPAHPEGFKESMLDMVMNNSQPAWTLTTKNQAELDAMIGIALDPVWQGAKTAKDAMLELKPQIEGKIEGRYDQ